MKRKRYYVYILTNVHHTVLYTGVTNNIVRRVWEHRAGTDGSFSKRYNLRKLVYLEEFSDVRAAIAREKQLKRWRRAWKLDLIGRANPLWKDLSDV